MGAIYNSSCELVASPGEIRQSIDQAPSFTNQLLTLLINVTVIINVLSDVANLYIKIGVGVYLLP